MGNVPEFKYNIRVFKTLVLLSFSRYFKRSTNSIDRELLAFDNLLNKNLITPSNSINVALSLLNSFIAKSRGVSVSIKLFNVFIPLSL